MTEQRTTQLFPAGEPQELPDEEAPGEWPPPASAHVPCACARCEEATAEDAELARLEVAQVTIVRTYKRAGGPADPMVKAIVTGTSGQFGIGHEHSDPLAILAALRNLRESGG